MCVLLNLLFIVVAAPQMISLVLIVATMAAFIAAASLEYTGR